MIKKWSANVSGQYRVLEQFHTEAELKTYSVSFEADPKTSPGVIIAKALALLQKEVDPKVKSLKTHEVVWQEYEVLEPSIEGPENVESDGSSIKPTGEDSGNELFE